MCLDKELEERVDPMWSFEDRDDNHFPKAR